MQIVTHCYPSTLATASLTTCAVAIENALFWAVKISKCGKWVARHDGDHVIHVTSDDFTGDRKVAQPSCVQATKIVTLPTRWWSSGMSKIANINFIQKPFLLNIVNRLTGMMAKTRTEDIEIQPVRLICGVHEYFVSVELFKVRVY